MTLVEFVKSLIVANRPELTDQDRKGIVSALMDIHTNQCKGDPVIGDLFGIVQRAILVKAEEDVAFLLIIWGDHMAHNALRDIVGGELDRVINSTLEAVVKDRVDCVPEGDVMQQFARCQECEKKADCILYREIEMKVNSTAGTVTN